MAATTYPTYGSTDDNNWYSDPANAPPNTTWDPATGTWKSTSPTATPPPPTTSPTSNFQTQPVGTPVTLPGSTGPTAPPPPSSSGLTAPSGGSVNDPSYVDKLLAYYATQPGVNPSVINDPNYWRQAAASGRFNGDTDYFIKRLMTPEGAPEGSGASGGGAGGSSLNFTQSSAYNTPQGQQLYDLLMKRANQGLNIDPNDPIIRQQTDAYSADQQRAERHYLSGLAEKAGDNGNITAETRHAAEVEGQNTGAFEGQLMQNEIAARRQEIQSALSGATGFLTDQMRLQLQDELTKLQIAENHFQDSANRGQRAFEYDNTRDDHIHGLY